MADVIYAGGAKPNSGGGVDPSIERKVNEALSLAKKANKAKGFASYSELIAELNADGANVYLVGQSFYIQTLDVPDLWVYSVEDTSVAYTYTTDNDFISAMSGGSAQVGYYKIAKLETLKQDLSNYVRNDDYATMTNAGVVKVDPTHGVTINDDGELSTARATQAQIQGKTNVYRPIVPADLDYAVKTSVSSNTIALTSAEKTTTQEWIGFKTLSQDDYDALAEKDTGVVYLITE